MYFQFGQISIKFVDQLIVDTQRGKYCMCTYIYVKIIPLQHWGVNGSAVYMAQFEVCTYAYIKILLFNT